MHKTVKKELSFSLDTLERYRSRRREAEETITSSVAEKEKERLAAATTTTSPTYNSISNSARQKTAGTQTQAETTQATTIAASSVTSSTTTAAAVAAAAATTKSAVSTTNSTYVPKSLQLKSSSSSTSTTTADDIAGSATVKRQPPGSYVNWCKNHNALAAHAWCAMSDLIYFCDKYEFKSLSIHDTKTQQQIVAEVRAMLAGRAPFEQRKRFPADIRDPENLWVCIGRCAGVEYHLNRILSIFRKPLDQLSPDKQRTVRQNFHLSVSELRLDISARISEVRLYDRLVFEREFRLEWQDEA